MRFLTLSLGLAVVLTDLLTKWWVLTTPWTHNYPVIRGFFTLQFVRNEGIAFGILHSTQSEWKPFILSGIAFIAIAVVVYYAFTTPPDERMTFVSLGLLLGGIIGNLVDRLVHGYVIDFLTLHWKNQFAWPTFNIADAAITCGVFLIVLGTFFGDRGLKKTSALLLFGCFIPPINGQDTSKIVNQLQKKYEGISSFSANFEQTFINRGISQSESGIVMMKRPGRMYWEYRTPDKKYFVADGKKTYFYVPKDNQMLVSELDLSEEDSPLLFLLGKGHIDRDFLVSNEPGDESTPQDQIALRLTPRRPQPEFSYILLDISSSNFVIRRLVVVEPIGQRNEYLITDLKQNVQISDKVFKLDVPSDVEVIEE